MTRALQHVCGSRSRFRPLWHLPCRVLPALLGRDLAAVCGVQTPGRPLARLALWRAAASRAAAQCSAVLLELETAPPASTSRVVRPI